MTFSLDDSSRRLATLAAPLRAAFFRRDWAALAALNAEALHVRRRAYEAGALLQLEALQRPNLLRCVAAA